jgi:dTDP-4-amino-4,6-dideoxygalactose transaminase
MHIPFVDLYRQYLTIKEEIDTAIGNTIKESSFIGGQAIKDFEASFANYAGVDHVIACANGTDSIEILLLAMGVGSGDEVIVPAISWISTSEAVSAVGATPVFVDIHPDFYTIDVTKIAGKLTPKTKAIIPVHLYGHPADMTAIMHLAKQHNLLVLEDCAQAHGARFNNQKVGTFGDAASFSFYPGKNLGAYGDAGAMTTNNSALAAKCRMIANHGQLKKHDHQMEGRNSRLDGLQAAILNVKLKYLLQWTAARQQVAESYTRLLSDVAGIKTPLTQTGAEPVFHLYVIQLENRENMMARLKELGIDTAVHYPTPLPFMKAYEKYGHQPADFPVAHHLASRILSLPIFPELTAAELQFVCESLRSNITGKSLSSKY